MKESRIYVCLFVAIMTFISCNINGDDGGPKFTETHVTGRAYDPIRNMGYSGDTIRLAAAYSCGSGVPSGGCYELIETTVTDADGNYEFTFDYDRSKGYRVNRFSEHSYYETGDDLVFIVPGEDNVIDFEGWRPVIFNVEVTVANNTFPDVTVQTRDDKNNEFGYDFPFVKISEQNTFKVLSLHGKPNTQMSIIFSYTDDHPTQNYHEQREIIFTEVQDSIDLSFKVDCSQF